MIDALRAWLRPDTLVGRVLGVLWLALLLSHAIAAGFWLDRLERREAVAGAAELGPRMAAALATALQTGLLPRSDERLEAQSHGFTTALAPADWRRFTVALAPSLGQSTAPWPAEAVVAMEFGDPGPPLPPADLASQLAVLARRIAEAETAAIVAFNLPDGSRLAFASPHHWHTRPGPVADVLTMLAAAGGLAALFVFAARRLAKPFERLAAAAVDAGDAVRAPPSPKSGPREARLVAETIDSIRRRLRSMIDERTRLLAAISHDLRTPATRMRLRAEFVEEDELREKMLADLDEMEAMIGDTLAFLRDDAAEEPVETVAFTAMLETICDELGDLGHPVAFHGPPPLTLRQVGSVFGIAEAREIVVDDRRSLRLACRPASLRRVFYNVIGNALKYGHRADVFVDADSDEIVVDVCDRGPGIPESEFENVFKPFYRLEGSRSRDTGGSGLGLSIVRSIVAKHGGRIDLANRPEGGLKVRIVLPRRF